MIQKRGQITIFAVIGVVIIFIVIFAFGLFPSIKKKISTDKTEFKDIVKSYAETCLTMISRNALRNLMGVQGGYIDTEENITYGEEGVPDEHLQPTVFNGDSVPYYLEAKCQEDCHGCCGGCVGDPCVPCTPEIWCHWHHNEYPKNFTPDLLKINQTFANYIAVEFEKCFDTSVFEDIGINVTKPIVNYIKEDGSFDFSESDIKVDIGMNEEDTSIKLTYPITIKKEGIEIKLDIFRVALPIRFKALYSSSLELVGKIVKAMETETTPVTLEYQYELKPEDCDSIIKTDNTNLFIKPFETELHEIAQFVDYSNFYEGYPPKSYFFQFAVKNIKFVDEQESPKDRCYP